MTSGLARVRAAARRVHEARAGAEHRIAHRAGQARVDPGRHAFPSAGRDSNVFRSLKKTGTRRVRQGTDFAEIAKQFSEDTATKETGGDLGWQARGMFTDIDLEREVFSLDVGLRTRQHSDRANTAWYKILEKDPARALDDEQKKKIKDSAYTYWLQEQKKSHGVQKLVPGHELDG